MPAPGASLALAGALLRERPLSTVKPPCQAVWTQWSLSRGLERWSPCKAEHPAVDHEQRLRKAQLALDRASRTYEDATLARNRAVKDAVAAGWTYRRIAAVTGLSQQRIAQIAKSPRQEG